MTSICSYGQHDRETLRGQQRVTAENIDDRLQLHLKLLLTNAVSELEERHSEEGSER